VRSSAIVDVSLLVPEHSQRRAAVCLAAGMGRFFARATRGIEWIAAAEIAGRAGGTVHDLGHREVHFSLSASGAGPLLGLRTVDDVFAWAGRVGGMGRARSSLGALARFPASGVAAAMASVAELRPVPDGAPFDVVASFLGRRNYNRFDIEDAVGSALAHVTGGSYVARRTAALPRTTTALSWRVHVRDDSAILGLRLGPRPLHRRASAWATVPGSLHPPVAAALVLLGGVFPGQWLGDPFCGSGTILAEYLHLAPTGRAVGVDATPDAVSAARANLTATACGDRALVAVADAAALPVRPDALDVVVTNPPWGRTVALHGSGPAAEARAWRTVAGSSARFGRLVVVSEEPPATSAGGVRPPPGWVGPVLSFGPLSVSGSKPSVFVYTRPDDPGGALPPPGALLASELARFADFADFARG
jgi:23S rRNA G2445 N2-methylase RlmL